MSLLALRTAQRLLLLVVWHSPLLSAGELCWTLVSQSNNKQPSKRWQEAKQAGQGWILKVLL